MPNKLAELTQPMQPGLLGAMQDQQFRRDVANGLLGALNRGAVAGLLGWPVDTAALALKPGGYDHPAPVGGSDWFCLQMERLGMVPKERNALAESIAAQLIPLGAMKVQKPPVLPLP